MTTAADSRESVLSFRIFSSPAGQARFRRATDILGLVVASIGVVLLVVAYPPSVFERSLDRFFTAIPGWFDPAWRFLYDALGLWAIALVVACLLARRWTTALDALAAFALALGIAVVSTRLAAGHWPNVWEAFKGGSGSPRFPAVLVAEATAVVLTVNGQLVRPLQSVGRGPSRSVCSAS